MDHVAGNYRGPKSVRSMIISLAVVGVVVAVMIGVSPHSAQDPVHRIDYSLKFEQASKVAPYPLLAPRGLPDRWRATSADFDGADAHATTWHLGFINPADRYAAVEQTNGASAPFVRDKGFDGNRIGVMQVAGSPWQQYDGAKYRSLVHVDGGLTTMVTGNASFEDLAVLAAALHPTPAAPTAQPASAASAANA